MKEKAHTNKIFRTELSQFLTISHIFVAQKRDKIGDYRQQIGLHFFMNLI